MQSLIHLFKYRQYSRLVRFFEREINQRWENLTLQGDWLIPVPLHPARLRERGFNQSQLLAELFSRKTRMPVCSGVLLRVRYTEQQAKLNAEERVRNVKGAFRVRLSDAVTNRHIVLVDDVLTTGSTLNECAHVLKTAGASQVDVLTLARVE